ncbi:hypothetical protein MTO96_003708 [Rhipicephalus appendiculatus]
MHGAAATTCLRAPCTCAATFLAGDVALLPGVVDCVCKPVSSPPSFVVVSPSSIIVWPSLTPYCHFRLPGRLQSTGSSAMRLRPFVGGRMVELRPQLAGCPVCGPVVTQTAEH